MYKDIVLGQGLEEMAAKLGYELLKGKVVKAKENNRGLFESKNTRMIYNLEDTGTREFMHHRNSGLNQVLCKLARDNDITIVFSLALVLSKNRREASMIMGRMMQNVRFCRKYGVGMRLASMAKDPYEMRAPKDMMSFGVCIGMSPGEAKRALE